jgi:hypothetical protein
MNSTTLAKNDSGHIPKPGEPEYSEELTQAIASNNEGRMHQVCSQLMKEWIAKHPLETFLMGIRRLLVLLHWNRNQGVWPLWYAYQPDHFNASRPLLTKVRNVLEDYAFIYYFIILISTLIAGILLIRARKRLSLPSKQSIAVLVLCILFYLTEQMIIYADRKYRYPLEPLMLLISAYFFSTILGKWEVLREKGTQWIRNVQKLTGKDKP